MPAFPRAHPQRRPRNCTHTWVQPEVLAMVGHELRQPLAALLVSAELVSDSLDELDRQQLVHLLTTIKQRVLGLQVLVNNLMQSTNGNFRLRSESFDIADLVADVRLAVEPLLTRSGQSLQVSATTLTVMADRARLAQVLVNLILNAGKLAHRVAPSSSNSLCVDPSCGLR